MNIPLWKKYFCTRGKNELPDMEKNNFAQMIIGPKR